MTFIEVFDASHDGHEILDDILAKRCGKTSVVGRLRVELVYNDAEYMQGPSCV
jgi:hypothetical protein